MKRKIIYPFVLLSALLMLTQYSFAQKKSADTVKCFAQCRVPFKYKIDTIKVVDKPEHKTIVKVPGSYLVTRDTIEYTSGDSAKKYLPAVYDVYEENVLVSSKNLPEKYKAVTKYIVLEEARTENLHNVSKHKPVTIYEQFEPGKNRKIEIPATFTYVITKTLASGKPQMIETEIICPERVTEKLIKQVQEHLKIMGYPTDNFKDELGETTLQSLEKYQQENQLPVGELNMLTLESLNIFP